MGDSLKTRASFRVEDEPTADKEALLQAADSGCRGPETLLRNTPENPPQS